MLQLIVNLFSFLEPPVFVQVNKVLNRIQEGSNFTEERSNFTEERSNFTEERSNLMEEHSNFTEERSNFTEECSNFMDERGNHTLWAPGSDPEVCQLTFYLMRYLLAKKKTRLYVFSWRLSSKDMKLWVQEI